MGEPDLQEALADLERPRADCYVFGDEPLWARLYAVEALHRLLPAALGMPLASLAGVLAWRRRQPREQALARARTFTGSGDPAEVGRFARRHLREYRMQDEIFWRPWLVPRMRIEGIERLEPGRGTIVAGVHVGPMAALQHALTLRAAAAGRRFYISRWDKIEGRRVASGPRARYVPTKVARLEDAGARFIGRGGSYRLIRDLLGRGEACWLAIDTTATERGRVAELAGRRVRLATGISALARETGATILPAVAYRDGSRPAASILEPVDPASFADADQLHDHLAGLANEMIAPRREQMMPDLAMAMEWGAAPKTGASPD